MSSSTRGTSGNSGSIWNCLWSFFTPYSRDDRCQEIAQAHMILGLDPAIPATKQEIDAKTREILRLCHPDRVSSFEEDRLTELRETVMQAKYTLYRHYGYDVGNAE